MSTPHCGLPNMHSTDPDEKTAYDRICIAADEIKAILTLQSERVATTPISEHHHWLGRGKLYCNRDANLDTDEALSDDLNTREFPSGIEGMCAEDMNILADDLQQWIENPQFVVLHKKWPLVPTWKKK